jgi:hypothetical protein
VSLRKSLPTVLLVSLATVMRARWRVVLPAVGLLLFAGLTYDSVRINRENNNAGRYFWWLTLRLDSEPGNSQVSASCNGANADLTSDETCQCRLA